MKINGRRTYMRTVIMGWIVGMFVLAPVTVWAVHPFHVEDTDTQGAGNFLLEMNGDFTKDSGLEKFAYSTILHGGVINNLDLSLDVPYLYLNPSPITDRNANGLGDIQFDLKQRIYENEVNQSFGYELYTRMPTGKSDQGLGTNKFVTGFKLIDQQGCCNTIYHVSLGYESFAGDLKERHFDEDFMIQFGFALEHKLTETFHLLTELNGEDRRGRDVDHEMRPFTYMAGFKYDISKSWYVDLAVRVGLDDITDYTTLAGAALRF